MHDSAVLIVGVELDRMLGNGGTWVFRTLVAYFLLRMKELAY